MHRDLNWKDVDKMSVWMKGILVIFSVFAIFILGGCETSVEKPLTKDGENEVQGAHDAVKREISIAADVKSFEMESVQKEEQETESKDGTETPVGNNEESAETLEETEGSSKTEAANSEDESAGESEAANSVNNDSTSNNEEEKSTKDNTSQDKTKNASKGNGSNQNNNESNKEDSDKKSKTTKNTLVYSIVISDSEVPLPPTEVEVKEGDSVLDVLIRITKEKGIQMDYRGGQGGSAYVEGIDNVYEFDRGQGSGWMYRVNGIFPDRGAGVVPLLSGDRVEWLYTIDLGKDLGADLQPFRR